MIRNKNRIGNFTSSKIAALLSNGKTKGTFGKPFTTYVEEVNMERRLLRSLSDEINAKPLTWGKILEGHVFNILGMEYILTSTETDKHPTIENWSGSKDGIKEDEGKTVIDIKCPITLKSFCGLVQPLYDGLEGYEAIAHIRENHSDGEKYYWQLVSNAILNDCRFAELIVYMPYESEILDIKLLADGNPNAYFIAMAGKDELPFIIDAGYYKNINIIRFEIPLEDKQLLTDRVIEGNKFLIDRYEIIEKAA